MRDIKAMLPEEIAAALAEMGQPKYRAKQIFQWLARGASSFDEMTNLSKDLRAALSERFSISRLEMLRKQVSAIDGTIKYLWQLGDGNAVETVVMHYKHGNTVCISSQVGCRQGVRVLRIHDRRSDPQPRAVRDARRGALFRAGVRQQDLEHRPHGHRRAAR